MTQTLAVIIGALDRKQKVQQIKTQDTAELPGVFTLTVVVCGLIALCLNLSYYACRFAWCKNDVIFYFWLVSLGAILFINASWQIHTAGDVKHILVCSISN